MGQQQISQMEATLDQWCDGIANEKDMCAGFDAASSPHWVQLTIDLLNIYWPFDEAAAETLQQQLQDSYFPDARRVDLTPGQYLTFRVDLLPADELAKMVDWLFTAVYQLPPSYTVSSEATEL